MSQVQNFFECETSNSKNRAYQWQPQASDFLHVQSTMMLPKNKILKLGTADYFFLMEFSSRQNLDRQVPLKEVGWAGKSLQDDQGASVAPES